MNNVKLLYRPTALKAASSTETLMAEDQPTMAGRLKDQRSSLAELKADHCPIGQFSSQQDCEQQPGLAELKEATGNLLSVIDKLNRQKNDALWSKCKSIQIEQECNHFFSWTYAKPSDEELIREILREL